MGISFGRVELNGLVFPLSITRRPSRNTLTTLARILGGSQVRDLEVK